MDRPIGIEYQFYKSGPEERLQSWKESKTKVGEEGYKDVVERLLEEVA